MGRLTHTVSGSIATVRSPAVAPIESLKVHFSPIQEGSGDPSPSNVRPITGWTGVTGYKAGKNLLPITNYKTNYFNVAEDGTISQINTSSASWGWEYNNCLFRTTLPAGTYTITETLLSSVSSGSHNVRIYSKDNTVIIDGIANGGAKPAGEYSAIFTLNETTDIGVAIKIYTATAKVSITSGNISYSYTPYTQKETIPVTFPTVGKNLFPIEIGNEIFVNNGSATHSENDGKLVIATDASSGASGVYIKSTSEIKKVYDIIEPPFTISMDIVASETGNVRIVVCGSQQVFEVGTSKQRVSVTATSKTTTNFNIYGVNNGATLTVSDLQIEKGSSATAYEPYNPDNTVYGGYVDLATGNVVATYAKAILDESISDSWWGMNSYPDLDINRFVLSKSWFKYPPKNGTNNVFINYCIARNHQLPWRGFIGSTGNALFYAPDDEITDKNSWIEYLSEHNLEICYEMGTPTVVATLTPQELATFKGYTNFWSNAGDVDVTYQVIESSEMTKERQKIFAGNAPTIHTASGSIANFEMEPGLNRNLKSCKIGFLPVQEGSGDPSPTNIRPIIGWSGTTVNMAGKNLLNPVVEKLIPFEDASYNHYSLNNGVITTTGNALAGFVVSVKPSTRYTFSFTKQGNANLEIFAYAEIPDKIRNSDQMIAYQNQNSVDSFTIPSDCNYIVCAFVSTISSNVISEFQLELGSTISPYTEYTGSFYSVTFPDGQTVYGGTLDAVSGMLMVDRAMVTFDGDEYWYTYSPSNYDSFCFVTNETNKKVKVQSSICNGYTNVTDSWGAGGNGKFGVFSDHSTLARWYFTRPNATFEKDVTAWKAWLSENPLQVCYELTTPYEIQLDPISIQTLIGDNTIWSDANGTIEVKYWSH